MSELQVLISRQQISRRVAELAAQITSDFAGQAVILVGVLKGATIFLSDLARELQLDATFDFIGTCSYGSLDNSLSAQSGWDSTGAVRLTKDVEQSLTGKNVLLVEDILDKGLTLSYIKNMLSAHRPKTLRTVALLDKPSRRITAVEADYVGFTIPDRFVVGYGMDYAEHYRNLPDICVIPGDGDLEATPTVPHL